MEEFFGRVEESKSHLRSLELVANKEIDCCIVDIMVYEKIRKQHQNPIYRNILSNIAVIPSLKFGPSPIQPFIISTDVPLETRCQIRNALLNANESSLGQKMLSELCASKFVNVTLDDYKMIFDWMNFLQN